MGFDVLTFVTDEGIGPVELGRALEERGFEALFLAEHTHVPVDAKTPYPLGGPIPRKYHRTLDPFVALTAAAIATEKLVLGTGIALVPQRDPILTAKEVVSLDLVSGDGFASALAWAGCEKRSLITASIPRFVDAWLTSGCAR
jgi:alkanesulfonate monooxygenase SsuD/methylene tetrahydromethanopterin reductase-like flavin-dependent oxidoreductase (luciferase family)